ncbi:MAG: tetratricopeptide repeat protein, partial [Sedimenticola sp.]
MSTHPLVAVITLLLLSSSAWGNPYANSEQRGEQLFQQGDFAEAAALFSDPYRRGVALYRLGDYPQAAKAFELTERGEVLQDALYNLGNSRFMQKDYEGAVNAFDKVLEQEPNHADAGHNRGLAMALLAQTDPEAATRLEEKKEKEEEEKQEAGDKKEEEQKQAGDKKEEEQKQAGDKKEEEQKQAGDKKEKEQKQAGDK